MIRLLLAATFCTATLSAAAAGATPLSIQYDTIVSGKAKPALVVTVGQPLKRLSIALTDGAGKKVALRSGALRRGATKRLPFRMAEGTRTFKGEVEATWAGGEVQRFTIGFSATKVGKMAVHVVQQDVDLDARSVGCRATNPAAKASLTIYGDSGEVIDTVEEDFDPPVPTGETITVTYGPQAEDIVRMDLKITDVAGFYAGMRITPFSITIPHEKVTFALGDARIRDSEVSKLKTTMTHIREALAKHGTLLTLKLFVAGFTDTVGGPASNRELSQRRARAIAAWFRGNGLKIPVYYYGFGEDVLAVPTEDEVEEEANRRALYILSSQAPNTEQTPTDRWKRL